MIVLPGQGATRRHACVFINNTMCSLCYPRWLTFPVAFINLGRYDDIASCCWTCVLNGTTSPETWHVDAVALLLASKSPALLLRVLVMLCAYLSAFGMIF